MAKGGGEGKVQVVDYYLSVHFGICHGPVDYISRIVVKDKEAWSGRLEGDFDVAVIMKTDLFGGRKKEGGVGGSVEFFQGSATQIMSPNVASRFRRTVDQMPAYRGLANVFFSGGLTADQLVSTGAASKGVVPGAAFPQFQGALGQPGFAQTGKSYTFADIPLDRRGGFYWSSNNPYMPDVAVRVTRVAKAPLSPIHARMSNLVPEAIIGLPATEEPEEGETPEVPDAENEDPLNGYYIGALPTEENFIRTQYGWKGTPQSVIDDPIFERRLFDVDNRDKLKIGGLIYRNYGDDSNPAFIIMEAMMDPVWGMSVPLSMFDVPSFESAAKTFFDERLGLSMQWVQQSTIEAFVTEVLDHVQATLFINPRNGLFTLRPIRGDYDPATLRTITPDNAVLRSFQRKAWGETVNEVVVTWTNPENEKDSTVTLQALANIGIQGAVVSDSRNYYGVRSAALAMKLCARDLRSASAPLATFEADLDRAAWDIVPGEVIKVEWPEEGIAGAVYRIMDVDYGRIGAGAIKVKFVEDVFALPTQGYTIPSGGAVVNFDGIPSPLDYLFPLTLPAQIVSRLVGLADAAYPDARVAILGATRNTSVESFEVRSKAVAADGKEYDTTLGQKNVTTHCFLTSALPAEFQSTVTAMSSVTRAGGVPSAGGLFILGETEGAQEICMFESYDEKTGYVLARGMLDTVPRAWPAGTPAWVVQFGVLNAFDPSARSGGIEVDYTILTRTSSAVLPDEDAQEVSYTPTDRAWRPTRPANCKVDGQAVRRVYASKPATGAKAALSWANRNRTLEDAVFLRWTQATAAPEPGQTTTIRVRDANGSTIAEHTGLAGTTFSLPLDGLSGDLAVCFFAVRDGLESLQAYQVGLELPGDTGYGSSYGTSYGA